MNLLFFFYPVIISLSHRNVRFRLIPDTFGIYNTSVIIFCVIHALAYFKQEISYIMTQYFIVLSMHWYSFSVICNRREKWSFSLKQRRTTRWEGPGQESPISCDDGKLFACVTCKIIEELWTDVESALNTLVFGDGEFSIWSRLLYYFWAVYWVANCLLHYSLASVLIPGSFFSSPLLDSCAVY